MPRSHDGDARLDDAQLFVYLSWRTRAGFPLLGTDEVRQAAFLAITSRARTQLGQILAIGGTPCQVHLVARFPPSLPVSVIVRTSRVSAQEAISHLWDVCGLPAATAPLWESAYTARTVSREDAREPAAYLRARITDANAARLP